MADYSVTSESENLRLQMRRMMDGLHVAMPAKVLAFQPGPPVRVTVQPATQMKITLGEEVSYRSLPQLSGVPVVLPFAQTAGFLLTVPIRRGTPGCSSSRIAASTTFCRPVTWLRRLFTATRR